MESLFEKNESVIRILGPQKESKSQIRPSFFVLEQGTEDGILLFNNLLKELILLTKEEEKIYRDRDFTTEFGEYLWSHYYFVPEEFDEYKTLTEVRNLLSLFQKKPKGINHYTILTTTDCNARCFYCYEAGCEKIHMTEEKAHEIASFIMRKREPDKTVKISWFGGEPLYNADVIDIISDDLKKENIPYESSMISNAYLFDEAMVKRAEKWNLKDIQITLDGTEEIYNSRKAYIYRDGSAFQKVLTNIGLLANTSVRISIRLNTDSKNAEDLSELLDILKERFGDKENVKVYARLLYKAEDEGDKDSYDAFYKLASKIEKYGMNYPKGLKTTLHTTRCMADSGNSVVVLPDGRLNSCEHFNEILPSWGIISSDSYDEEIRKEWLVRKPPVPLCRDCAYAPDCLTLKACPSAKTTCYDLMKDRHIRDLKAGMLTVYKRKKAGKPKA